MSEHKRKNYNQSSRFNASGYWVSQGKLAGRSKVEQNQVLASRFEGRTSVRLVRSYSSYRPGPITGLQSRLPELLLGPQADLLGLPLPPSGLACLVVDLREEAPVSRTRTFPIH
ncbi:hypothetical protein FF1_035738 [Malus domestica]